MTSYSQIIKYLPYIPIHETSLCEFFNIAAEIILVLEMLLT